MNGLTDTLTLTDGTEGTEEEMEDEQPEDEDFDFGVDLEEKRYLMEILEW